MYLCFPQLPEPFVRGIPSNEGTQGATKGVSGGRGVDCQASVFLLQFFQWPSNLEGPVTKE